MPDARRCGAVSVARSVSRALIGSMQERHVQEGFFIVDEIAEDFQENRSKAGFALAIAGGFNVEQQAAGIKGDGLRHGFGNAIDPGAGAGPAMGLPRILLAAAEAEGAVDEGRCLAQRIVLPPCRRSREC